MERVELNIGNRLSSALHLVKDIILTFLWTMLICCSSVSTFFLTYAIVDLSYGYLGLFLQLPIILRQSWIEDLARFVFIALITISSNLTLLFLAKRRRKSRITIFRKNLDARLGILTEERWGFRFFILPLFSFLVASLLGLSLFLLKFLGYSVSRFEVFDSFHMFLSEIITAETTIFPYLFSALIGFAFGLGLSVYSMTIPLNQKERLTFMADTLKNLLQSKELRREKELNFFAKNFVMAFGDAVFSTSTLIREIDLSSLSPIILAMFLGTDEEKAKVEQLLHKLQKVLGTDKSDWQTRIIEWLQETEGEFPRVSKLDSKIKIHWVKKKGILSKIRSNLTEVVYVITIITSIVAIVFYIISMLKP